MENIRLGRIWTAFTAGSVVLAPAAPAWADPGDVGRYMECKKGPHPETCRIGGGSGSGFDLGTWTSQHPALAVVAGLIVIAVAVVVIGALIGALGGQSSRDGKRPVSTSNSTSSAPGGGPAESADSTAAASSFVMVSCAAAVVLTFFIGGFSWAVLVAIPAVIVALIARSIRRGSLLEARGHRIAAQRHADDVRAARRAYDEAQAEAVDPFSDLPGIAPAAPPAFAPPRAPRLTAAQARDLAETGGWTAPAGSALAAVCDRAGRPTPAVAAVDQVARQLKWGAWETDAHGAKMWTPYVAVKRVAAVAGGDARLTLAVSHASVDEGVLTKALPSLCRALRVRSGVVEVDHRGGQLVLTVTTRRDAQAGTVDAPAEPEAGW